MGCFDLSLCFLAGLAVCLLAAAKWNCMQRREKTYHDERSKWGISYKLLVHRNYVVEVDRKNFLIVF